MNSPEDGPVGPKHVEIRRYMNEIEIVTSVGFSFHNLEDQAKIRQLHQSKSVFGCRTKCKSDYRGLIAQRTITDADGADSRRPPTPLNIAVSVCDVTF